MRIGYDHRLTERFSAGLFAEQTIFGFGFVSSYDWDGEGTDPYLYDHKVTTSLFGMIYYTLPVYRNISLRLGGGIGAAYHYKQGKRKKRG